MTGSLPAQRSFVGLPGAELLSRGLSDLRQGRRGAMSLLVAMAWPRLARLDLVAVGDVLSLQRGQPGEAPIDDLELAAYGALLARHGPEAHGRYLALCAELESALNALEREQRTVR